MVKLKSLVDKALSGILVVLMSLLVIDVLWQVFSRYVLNDPSSFTEELARFLLMWVGLLGASYAAGRKMHLAVDILPNKLEGKRKSYLNLFILVCTVLFALTVMVFGGIRLVTITLFLGQTAAALQMPLGYVYLILPISGLLIAFYAILFIIDEFRSMAGKPALFDSNASLSSPSINVD
ncbi:MAG: TRAP transporter small permease [Rhodothermales bacterium]